MIAPNLTAWFIQELTGSPDTVMDWRCIHDQRKDLPAHNYRGTLTEMLPTLEKYNNDGYGVFCNINAMDGVARNLENVQHIRAHVIDLDSMTAPADFERASAAGASFVVQTSPNKFHVYFRVEPYQGNEFYTLQQRKFAQLYSGDPKVIDPTRIIRAPGFNHCKGEPILVTGWQLPNFEKYWSAAEIEASLSQINLIEHLATRSPLGEPSMAAPSLEWLEYSLQITDPNEMDRGEWLSFSAAFKQAGWSLTTPEHLHQIWSEWCARFGDDDPGENLKLWDSVKDTEVGWASIKRKTAIGAYMAFGHKTPPTNQPTPPPPTQGQITPPSASEAVAKASEPVLLRSMVEPSG